MREVKEALRELKEIQQQAYDKGYEDVASRLCVRIKYICEDHGFEEEYRRQVEKLEKIPFSDPLKASEYLLAFHALNGRAELFRKSKKYQEAKNLHLKAFNLYSSGDEPHHNIWLQVYALYHLAALEYERRNLVEARQYIDRAYETARDNKIHDRAIKCLQLKTEIVLLEQDYKDAYLSMKLIQDHRMTIDSLQEGFDMEKYYIQIERQKLAAEKEAQSLELRLKNGEMISFSVIALLAIVLAVAMFLSMRRQSRDTRQLAGQYALIRQQAQQLQSLDVAKTRFFTNISHEFRTPLTVILGMAEQIKTLLQESVSQPYPPENPHPALAPHYLESMRQEGQQHITLIQRNGKNLLQLVNQILDLSKMDSGLLTVNWHHGNIIAYLQYLTESFYSLAQNKGVCLVFYSEVTVLNMDYDPEKTQAVVINLLSNALKFTQKGGKIVLHTSQLIAAPDKPEAVGCLQLKFQDSGKGIPSDELPHIFNRFYQVDDSSTRLNEGTGIGLSLVKEFVGLLGGSIGVESTIGQGTTFNLLLPIHHQAEGLESIPQSASTSTSLRPSGSGEAPASARSRPVLGDTKLPLLLLIEDNADVVTYLTGLLENTYQIEWAADGQTGIDIALDSVPDIIISDVMMPEKDGYEVCDILKNDQRTSHIPIILLTAKATQPDKLAGLQAGADAYLEKPFDKEELFVWLEKLRALRITLQTRYTSMTRLENFVATTVLEDEESSTASLDEQFMQKVRDMVEEGMNDPDLSIVHLCRVTRISHTQVFRKLKALTGENPTQYIRRMRLERALELIQTTSLNISEIAHQVGFNDANYFSRVFQEKYGKRPVAMRK